MLPAPHQSDQHAAYNFYIGGLTFLSLNDIHWQCESTVFGNFFACLKAMMEQSGDWKTGTNFTEAMVGFLDEMFPTMDERDRFAELCARYEAKDVEGVAVTLKEAGFMKLFCDAYFMRRLMGRRKPVALDHKQDREAPIGPGSIVPGPDHQAGES